jgi:hypothetical protein
MGLSFTSSHTLYQLIDNLSNRGGSWQHEEIEFDDRPGETFTLHYRDIISAIRGLWGDPAFADCMVYRPQRIFTDASKKERVYSEMWTGSWWWSIQVLLLL